MRKLNKGTIGIISASVVLVVGAIIGLYLPAFLNAKEPIVVPAKSIVFDKYDNQYETKDDMVLNSYWDGTKAVKIEDKQVVLGDSSIAFNGMNKTATLLMDGVVIMPDNTFYSVKENKTIEESGNNYKVEETNIDSGTVVKTGDRNYVVLGNSKIEGGKEFQGFTTVSIDKAGIPTISNYQGVYRYSDPKVLVFDNGSQFDMSNEVIKTKDNVSIDLKQVGGSTNEYVELGKDPATTDKKEADANDQNSNNANGTGNNNNNNSNNNATGNGTGSGDTSKSNAGGTTPAGATQAAGAAGSSGESFTVTEDMYKALFTKKPPTGNIMGVDEVGPVTAKVHVNYFDSSNTLIGNPTIKVLDSKGGEVYSTVINGSSVVVNSLSPNQKYTVQLFASYDLGEGVTTSQLANSTFVTTNISQDTTVNVVRSTSADVTVKINGNINVDSAFILLESSANGTDWNEESRTDLNAASAAKNGMFVAFSNLSPSTMHRVSIKDAEFSKVPVSIDGYAYFTTLAANKVSGKNSIKGMSVSSADNNVDIKVAPEYKSSSLKYEYSLKNVADNKTDSFLQTTAPNVKFNQFSGLQMDAQYVAEVVMLEDGVEVNKTTSDPFVYKSDFLISSIQPQVQKTVIMHSGVGRLVENSTLYLYKVGENGSLEEVYKEDKKENLGNQIILPLPIESGNYQLVVKSSKNEIKSNVFNYIKPETKNIKTVNDKIYVNSGSKIEVLDAKSGKTLVTYSVMENNLINIFETIEDFYVLNDSIFAVTNSKKLMIFNDEKHNYKELNEVKIQGCEELEGKLYIKINDEIKEIK